MCPGLFTACLERAILPICVNGIYLDMRVEKKASCSRAARARGLSRGPRRARPHTRAATHARHAAHARCARLWAPPGRAAAGARAGNVARLQVNIKNAKDVLGERGRGKAPTPSWECSNEADTRWEPVRASDRHETHTAR